MRERIEIKKRWKIDPTKPLFLHVGHLRETRGLDTLLAIKRSLPCEVLVVGSTSTDQRAELVRRLMSFGIHIISEYLPRIETIYQCADCYLFPTFKIIGSIAVPLSVLEAMACNLPVVAYPFGELGNLFGEANGLYYAQDDAGFIAKATEALKCRSDTRKMVMDYSWQKIAKAMLLRLTNNYQGLKKINLP